MYYCEMCDYETEDRDRIHYHHIKPKSMKGSDKSFNRLYCCPNCHHRIYITGSKGIHGIKGVNPIVIESKMLSSAGMVVEYSMDGKIDYKLLKNTY
jgi:hypothetical protein